MTSKLFSELGLSQELLKAIDKLGFEQASPIQAEAIPVLMAGRDIVGQSQTGSGKTAAFAIPAIEKTDPNVRAVQVLILCPTRELAVQVSEEFHKLALFKRGVHALPIYGGQSYERQFHGLRQGAQIVIGTPGRVMDHMRRGTLRLDTVKLVVLDEADVMLNMGFRDDIDTILQAVPKERQTVFFSATMPPPIRELIEKHSREPQSIQIEQKALTVPTVEQVYYEVDRRFKLELLTRLIDIHDLKLGIIFCNTKRMVDDLVDHLEAQGYLADRLHGDMTQNMRDRVMSKFRQSGLEFLVATDVAARGIDVDDVQVVFNYDLPYDVEDYVHRIGRTGRAGRSGRAISFVAGREVFQIRNIERFTNCRIHRARIPTEAEVEEARDTAFLGRLRATLQSGDFKRYEHLIERLLEEGYSSTDIAAASLAQLQSGEAAPARPARTEEYERPPRPERPEAARFREAPRERSEERRGPRLERAERPSRFERPRRSGERPERPQAARGIFAKGRPAVPPRAAVTPTSPPPPAPSTEGAAVAPTVEPVQPVVVPVPAPSAESPSPAERTYTDAEILASVKKPEPPPRRAAKPLPPWMHREESGGASPRPADQARKPGVFTRLHMNLGEEMGITPGDVVGAIAGETGLPGDAVGRIDVRARHLFVEVASLHAQGIIAKLNRAQIKGRRVKVKLA
ncbi:MAG TPA: DEAD/DEAH box helicase [Methylomirabilota bacterium]|nr:DEAD/DEAH box helicase [Methylomirabilota bacterium]